jgi:hypothetical protein
MLLEVVDQIDSTLEGSGDDGKFENEEEQSQDEILETPDDPESESELLENDSEVYVEVKNESDDEKDLPVEAEEVVESLRSDFDETSQEVSNFEETAVESPRSSSKRKAIRQAHPENWLRNKRKLAKNSGQSYYASNGKFVEAKEMKCKCVETCRMQCSKKISEENRFINFNHFYSLGDIEKQRKFLFDHMRTYQPKRKQTTSTCQKSRAVQRCYYLDLIQPSGEVEMIQVCRLMFLNTFVISSQMIDTLHRKAITEGQFNDIRGKFPKKR